METAIKKDLNSDAINDMIKQNFKISNEFVLEDTTSFIPKESTPSAHFVNIPTSLLTSGNFKYYNNADVLTTAAVNVTVGHYVTDNSITTVDNRSKVFVTRKFHLYGENDKTVYTGNPNINRNLHFYSEIYAAIVPANTGNWAAASDMNYAAFYAACRVAAIACGWIAVHGNAETNFSATVVPNAVTAFWDSVKPLLSVARDALIMKAINFWHTNHSMGQGRASNFVLKSLKLLKIIKEDVNELGDVYGDIYNAVHFADNRSILYSVFARDNVSAVSFSAITAIGLNPPVYINADNFCSIRLNNFPAGTAKYGLIYNVLATLMAKKYSVFMPSYNKILNVCNDISVIMKIPTHYHVGRTYLNQTLGNTLYMNDKFIILDKNSLDDVFKDIATFINVAFAGSTLSLSPSVRRIALEVRGTVWSQLISEFELNTVMNIEQFKVACSKVKITGGSTTLKAIDLVTTDSKLNALNSSIDTNNALLCEAMSMAGSGRTNEIHAVRLIDPSESVNKA